MPRFFVNSSDISESNGAEIITVSGDDAAHISRVLRMRAGEKVTACDENGREYLTVIREVGQTVLLEAVSSKKSESEPPYRLTVYQALVKGDRFDTVLQKATETGATDFVPMMSSRCVVTLEAREYAKKIERWQRIVLEASKQCGRGAIPTVHQPKRFEDAVRDAARDSLPLFCYEGEGTLSLTEIMNGIGMPESVSVVVGPEGGFSETEAAFAHEQGMKMTGLGKRILRTETAAPFVLAGISCKYEL